MKDEVRVKLSMNNGLKNLREDWQNGNMSVLSERCRIWDFRDRQVCQKHFPLCWDNIAREKKKYNMCDYKCNVLQHGEKQVEAQIATPDDYGEDQTNTLLYKILVLKVKGRQTGGARLKKKQEFSIQ